MVDIASSSVDAAPRDGRRDGPASARSQLDLGVRAVGRGAGPAGRTLGWAKQQAAKLDRPSAAARRVCFRGPREDRSRSHKLYHVLGTLLQGKLRRIVMLCPERNGYEAYKLIIKEVTPQDRAGPTAQLRTPAAYELSLASQRGKQACSTSRCIICKSEEQQSHKEECRNDISMWIAV